MKDEAVRCRQLEARIHQYHRISLAQVLRELAYLRNPDDFVLVGGSLAYGLGNKLSDFDAIVVGNSDDRSSGVPLEHFVSSLRVDVWRLSERGVIANFSRAEDALASSTPLRTSFGGVDRDFGLKLLSHTAFGIVVDGRGFDRERQLHYQSVASAIVIREFVERMRTSALLAQLYLQANRPIGASANARLAVEEAVNAMLAWHGLPFSGEKWLSERIGSHFELGELYQPFRQLPGDPAGAAPFVQRAVTVCSRMWGLKLDLPLLAPATRWEAEDLTVMAAGGESLLVSHRSGALWRLDEREAETCKQAATDSQTGGVLTVLKLKEGDEDMLSLCASLHEHGLLTLSWTTGVPPSDLKPLLSGPS